MTSFLNQGALSATSTEAAVPLLNGFGGPSGYGEGVLPRNDDGSTTELPLAIGGAMGGVALSTLGAGSAQAIVTDPGLVSFEIDCNCSNTGYEGTVGWDFQVNVPHTINYLGVYDADADGLAVATEVGLWNRDTSQLLASTFVPQGTAGHLLGKLWTNGFDPFAGFDNAALTDLFL